MSLDLNYVTRSVGGQSTPTVSVPVAAKDIIVAQGTVGNGGCALSLSGISARLVGTWVGGQDNRMRTSVWEALAGGTAQVTISGDGNNKDLVACVVRPTASPRGKLVLRTLFDGVSPYSVATPVQAGAVLFITQHGGSGWWAGVGTSAQTTGVSFTEWYNVLPEGATNPVDGRMIARKVASSGTAVTSGGTAWILVAWLEEDEGVGRRTGFVMV